MRPLPMLLLFATAQLALPQDAKPLACEDEKQVQDLTAACAALVEKAEGKPFPAPPAVRIVSRDEVSAILKEEMAPQMKALAPGQTPEAAAALLDQTVALYSLVFLCKYGWEKKAIYVVPENFKSMSETLKNPKLLDPEMLRAMLTHELVHAHDDLVLDLGAVVARADDEEKLNVLNALVEGHAQFVAKGILAKEGKAEWFDEMTRTISAGPPDMDEGTKAFTKLMGARMIFAYEDGLRFFEQLEKAGKLPEFAALVKDPPKSRSAIVNIGEYLGTAKAPAAVRDLKAVLAPLAERYKAPDYQVVSKALSSVDLRGTMTGVGDDEAAAIVASFRGGYAFIANSEEGQMICIALELADADGAKHFLAMEEKVSKNKDETFKEGQIRVLAAAYDKLATKGLDEGMCVEKKMSVAGQDVFVRVDTARVGNLVIEMTYSMMPIERADQEAWVAALLGVGKPPAPSEKKAAGVKRLKGPFPDRVCVNNLRQLGTYMVMWCSKFGNDRTYPGPGTKFFADLLTQPDREHALLKGSEGVLVCPCDSDEAFEKFLGGDYDASGYEVTDQVLSDGVTHPEDPIVWDKKAAHKGKRNVLLFGGSVVQMTDEELDAARKKANR